MISHGCLMAHLRDMTAVYRHDPSTRFLNWLPHHHDYGLVQGLLLPLYLGAGGYIMSPTSFIRKPWRWLEAISTFRINHSQGTPFAYAYCLQRFDSGKAAGLDLSCWHTASVGAEPINPEVLQRFRQTFLPLGFKPTALVPGYGLAEATLMVSTRRTGSGIHLGRFAVRGLMNNRAVESDNQAQRTLVSCGPVVSLETRVMIVDPQTRRRCQANEIGEIWVAGPGVAQGYWRRPEETEHAFCARLADSEEKGPFLRTGDLGFIAEGELFITGRYKDLIIIHGQNHSPSDIELAAEVSHPRLRPGRCAAFSVQTKVSEQLVVVAEIIGAGDQSLYRAVIGAINKAVGLTSELTPHAIVLIRSGSLPVTSSGKIQRRACHTLYTEGTLDVVYRHIHETGDESLEPQTSVIERTQRQAPLERLLEMRGQVNDEVLRAYLVSVLAEAMNSHNLDWVEPDQDLLEMGIDSLAAVQIRTVLEEELGLSLPINLIYSRPTLNALGALLREKMRSTPPPQAHPAAQAQPEAASCTSIRQDQAKRSLLDWRVTEQDTAYDLPGQALQDWDRLSLPPDKVRMRQYGTRVITDDWKPKAPFIHRDTKVLGMGSCFTRDIILWLAECGFNRCFPGSPYNALLRYPAIGNNAYLAAQFRVLETLSATQTTEHTQVEAHCRFLDASQDQGRPLYQLLQAMDVLLLTLGSLETWTDIQSGTVLRAPMVLAEYSPQRHRFAVDSFADTRRHLETIDRVAREHFPHLKIIFTLPLGRMATYRPLSALNAASVQEATLRAALAEFLGARSDDLGSRLYYFPAYDLMTQFFSDPYRTDNSHATPYVTGRLCASFAEMFCADPPQTPALDSLAEFDPFHAQALDEALHGKSLDSGEREMQSKIAALEAENASLKHICDERLVVIEGLDKAARERLALIEHLDARLRAYVR